jgi:hypothetical protein
MIFYIFKANKFNKDETKSLFCWTSFFTVWFVSRVSCSLSSLLIETYFRYSWGFRVGKISNMLSSTNKLMNSLLVNWWQLYSKWTFLILFISVKKDVVHAKSPRINALVVPSVHKLRSCWNMFKSSFKRNLSKTFYIHILFF